MAHALCMLDNKARDTHSENVILIVFLPQLWLHESISVLCYTHTAGLVLILTSSMSLFFPVCPKFCFPFLGFHFISPNEFNVSLFSVDTVQMYTTIIIGVPVL